jgi:hypothetical protein
LNTEGTEDTERDCGPTVPIRFRVLRAFRVQ